MPLRNHISATVNILLTVPNYFPNSFGGIQTYVHCLAKELLCRGHQIIVVTAMPRQNDDEPFEIKEYLYKNIKVIAYSIDPDCIDARELHIGSGPLKRRLLRDILTECGPDVVHSNDMDPTITSLCNEMRIPHVVTAHAVAMACPSKALLRADSVVCEKPMNPQDCTVCYLSPHPWYTGGLIAKIPGFLYQWYGGKLGKRKNLSYLARGLLCPWLIEQDILEKRSVLNLAQCIVAPSLFVRDLLARNGCDFRKILMIAHGIDPIKKSPIEYLGKRPVRFAYIGRISRRKGLHILLESARLLPEDSACEIHIFGATTNDEDEKYRKQILSAYKGRATIFSHGLIPHDKLYEAFAIVDVLVVPSLIPEAFGLVVQEAFTAGRPVIVANSGGLAERVRDGIDGFVVEPNNRFLLSQALQKIIANPGLIRDMTKDLPHVKTTAEYVDEMEALYRHMIDCCRRTNDREA
jgi:glycosyltransferase involved in cell wall biosynthesis